VIILQTTDFSKGFYALSQTDFTEAGLQTYIDDNEEALLCKLLGVELADLFVADLVDGVPQTQRFIDIFNKFKIQPDECIFISKGMKIMLEGFMYYIYIINENVVPRDTGVVTPKNENSDITPGGALYRNADKRWNDSVITAEAIQAFICEDLTTYPEFKGERFTAKYAGIL